MVGLDTGGLIVRGGAYWVGIKGRIHDQHLCLKFSSVNIFYSQDGRTPLMMAIHMGHFGCVQLLLDRGAQINYPTKVSAV